MTVSNTNPPVTRYSGNGATTAFATVFAFNVSSELVVTLTDSSGTDTVQTITTHYTVTGGSGSTGTVTFLTAPASGYTVTIERVTPLTQSVDYVENDSFPAESHEGALDKLTRIVQEMDYANRRALLYSATSGIVDLALPNPTAGYFLRWNGAEDGLENAVLASVGTYTFSIGTGILSQTADDTATVRTLTGTANQIAITNGDGVAGNPTFGFDTTVRLSDSVLEIVDNADSTKKLKFEVSGVTTATTRTLTVPNSSGTIALTSDITVDAPAAAQYVTLATNATLTSERVLTAGSGVTLTDAGAGSTITVAADIATQSDQETGSSTTKIVTSGRQHFHPSAAKGWCYYTCNSTTVLTHYNMSAVADTGTGIATITIDTDLSSDNYVASATSDANSGTLTGSIVFFGDAADEHDSASLRIESFTYNTGAFSDAVRMNVVIFGDI